MSVLMKSSARWRRSTALRAKSTRRRRASPGARYRFRPSWSGSWHSSETRAGGRFRVHRGARRAGAPLQPSVSAIGSRLCMRPILIPDCGFMIFATRAPRSSSRAVPTLRRSRHASATRPSRPRWTATGIYSRASDHSSTRASSSPSGRRGRCILDRRPAAVYRNALSSLDVYVPANSKKRFQTF
jgi:hypothetical protein